MPKKGFRNPRVSAPVKLALPAARRSKPDPAALKAKAQLDAERSAANHQTPEADQHSEYGVKVTQAGKRRAYNITSSNLDYYLKKSWITDEQWAAGNRLFTDFTHSRLVSGFKSCLNVTIGGRGGVNKAGLNFQAYEAYIGAVEKMHVRHRKLVINVCCAGEWLADVKSSIPQYRRMDSLTRGLDELIEYYESKINPRKVMQSFHASVTTTMGPAV